MAQASGNRGEGDLRGSSGQLLHSEDSPYLELPEETLEVDASTTFKIWTDI